MKSFLLQTVLLVNLVQATPLRRSAAEDRYNAYRAQAYANQIEILSSRKTGCNLDTVIVRKEWQVSLLSTLSLEDRKDYTDAVICLSRLPSIKPHDVIAPGIKTRYDDFHANHINQTYFIHFSAYFLPWHRYFLHAFEKALRDECGYKGAQAYWDWSAGDVTPGNNALFSGEGSIGGNGESIPHDGPIVMVPPTSVNRASPGTGGGCILDGPFVNLTNNVGPYGPPQVTTGFDYNPRCIKRDFRPNGTRTSLTYEKVIAVLDTANLDRFQAVLESSVHPGGHIGIGGQQDDLYSGNGDPAFYFHHAQVDHIWNIWQAQDITARMNQVSGTLTINNNPPSPNGTLDTTLDLGYNGRVYAIRDLVSTINGPLCYIYE